MQKPGIILIASGLLAMALSNSALAPHYFAIVNSTEPVHVLFIINDVLMAIFFLDVGLEIKHQIVVGHLARLKQIILPTAAAIGGVILPVTIYILCNYSNPNALHGFAIPAATDIAFALGVLILLGNRIPLELRVMLLTIAVLDDLLAILIIAVFYSSNIQVPFLLLATVATCALLILNKSGVKNIVHYLMLGVTLWYCMYKGGLHPTLSGVITALTIPLSTRQSIHKQLYIWVSYVILPVFALSNAGISLTGMQVSELLEPVTVGIVLGLFIGKPLGAFGFAYLATKAKLAVKPKSITWAQLYGMSILCGIGFTMSVFIGNLAFANDLNYLHQTKVGVLAGTTMSALYGYIYLRSLSRAKSKAIAS